MPDGTFVAQLKCYKTTRSREVIVHLLSVPMFYLKCFCIACSRAPFESLDLKEKFQCRLKISPKKCIQNRVCNRSSISN